MRAIEGLSESLIRGVIAATPASLLTQPYRAAYEEFLLERQRRIRAVMAGHRSIFPNLNA